MAIGAVLGLLLPASAVSAQTTSGYTDNFVNDVSCPTQTECFAVGGSNALTGTPVLSYIASTNNGGNGWWRQGAPSTAGSLESVTCPTAEDCYAVGQGLTDQPTQTIIATTDAGLVWTQQTVPAGAGSADGFSVVRCPTAIHCYAIGNDQQTDAVEVVTTTDGGSTWTSEPGPTGLSEATGLSCPGPNTCFVAGSVEETDPYGDFPYGAAAVAATFDGGQTWVTQFVYGAQPDSAESNSSIWSISCPTATDCLAGGSGIWGTTDAGHSWSIRTKTGITDEPIGQTPTDCPRPTDCYYASGQDIQVSTNGGWTYTDETDYGVAGDLIALYCPTYFRCYGTDGSQVAATTDSGQTWVHQALPGIP
jgi:photosystem II stability/assembly factor-like uncharacterized protein